MEMTVSSSESKSESLFCFPLQEQDQLLTIKSRILEWPTSCREYIRYIYTLRPRELDPF